MRRPGRAAGIPTRESGPRSGPGGAALEGTQERAFDFLERAEKFDRLLDGQLENLRDVFAAIFDVEGFAIETGAVANLAADEGRRQEIHFEFDRACAFALGATTLCAIEGKAAG